MNNVTREDRKHIRKGAAANKKRPRKAENPQELELLMAVGILHIIDYYERHPIRRILTRLGLNLSSEKRYRESMDLAHKELADVDFNYQRWREKYGRS